MKRFISLLSILLFLTVAATSWGAVRYVAPDGSDLSDGQSWDSALGTIQKAVDLASDGDEVWVAAGTYDLYSTVFVSKALGIYGGFAGNESQLAQRDWVNNASIVDGKIRVQCFYVTADATIDGLTVRNGYTGFGGGIRINSCAPAIANCVFSDNRGNYYGGAMYNYYASPTISGCTFYGNSAKYVGGGIYNTHASPTITNTLFHQNIVDWTGGAIGDSNESSPTITNCTFFENSAGLDGGAIDNYSKSSPMITNCTFYKNTAVSRGRGIDNSFTSAPVITNCIFWGNLDDTVSEIANDPGSFPDVAYSDIQGGYAGDGNIDQDPSFVDPDNGDFHLQPESPCIDAGTDNVLSLPAKDFEGDPRVAGALPDMGVDEVFEDGLDAYVLYAKEKIRLRRIADSQGNVGSNGRIVVAWGRSGTIEGDLSALEKIWVSGSITIDGDVLTNGDIRVHRRGRLNVTGACIEGEDAGLSATELPVLDFTTGSPNIRVWRRNPTDLEPGSYGKVRVMRGATLHLSSGDYYMRKLDLGSSATLSIDCSDGPITINVVEKLRMGRRAKVEIQKGSTKDVTFNVEKCRPVWVGSRAEFRGTLVAPNSRVWFGYRSEIEGAVHARSIYAGCRVQFSHHAE